MEGLFYRFNILLIKAKYKPLSHTASFNRFKTTPGKHKIVTIVS